MAVPEVLHKPVPNMVARVAVVLLGMTLVAFGIALSRQTLLGSSPISTIPTVLSFAFPISVGTFTFFYSILLLLAQWALLRSEFSPVQLLQLPFIVVFSITIDLWVAVVEHWSYASYPLCLFWIFVAILAVGLGVYLQTQMRLIMLPGDAVVVDLAAVLRQPFSRCKICFDIAQVIVGVVLSMFFNGYLYGVREGTVLAAIFMGPTIKCISKLFGDFERFVPVEGPCFLPSAKNV